MRHPKRLVALRRRCGDVLSGSTAEQKQEAFA